MSSKEGAATCTQWPYDSGQDTPLRLQCAHSTTADAVDPRCLRPTRLGVNQQRRQQRHGTNTLGYPRDLLLADGKPAATKSYTWPRQKNNNFWDKYTNTVPLSSRPFTNKQKSNNHTKHLLKTKVLNHQAHVLSPNMDVLKKKV